MLDQGDKKKTIIKGPGDESYSLRSYEKEMQNWFSEKNQSGPAAIITK
jgi:hypothetical protein